MMPISLYWDTKKRWLWLKWDGVVSLGWDQGKRLIKILGFSIPFPYETKRLRSFPRPPLRWVYLKGFFSFLTKWKVKKMEATLSLPDPMINGVLYGWMSAFQTARPTQKVNVTINFLGENRWKGELILPLRVLLLHLRKWVFPLIREIWRKRLQKGGETRWKQRI